MLHSVIPLVAPLLLACGLAAAAPAKNGVAMKYRTNPPPSADLTYAIKLKQHGLALEGTANVKWQISDNKFVAATETRAMVVGKILETKSEGVIDAYGLAPLTFTEKRFRKEAVTTSFDRAANIIHFAKSEQPYPLQGGEQDRNSAIWQLISIARAAPAKFKAGSEWGFVVAGQRDAAPWTFKVIGHEKLRTPMGELNTVHVSRLPPGESDDQELDIWLAPALEWYPVRLRFFDPDNELIEQTLTQVRKAS